MVRNSPRIHASKQISKQARKQANETGGGELYDPVASAFRVKLVRNDALGDCRFRGSSKEGVRGRGDRRQ